MTEVTTYADGGAGHRGLKTSIAGAAFIEATLPRLQRMVCAVIADAGETGATADEVAHALGWVPWRVRPRTSELRRDGKIIDSGGRRPGLAGVNQIVWCLPEHESRNGGVPC